MVSSNSIYANVMFVYVWMCRFGHFECSKNYLCVKMELGFIEKKTRLICIILDFHLISPHFNRLSVGKFIIELRPYILIRMLFAFETNLLVKFI